MRFLFVAVAVVVAVAAAAAVVVAAVAAASNEGQGACKCQKTCKQGPLNSQNSKRSASSATEKKQEEGNSDAEKIAHGLLVGRWSGDRGRVRQVEFAAGWNVAG